MTSTDPAGRPKIWGRVPPRNRDFTGRSELLAQLHPESPQGVTLVTALQGLGGVGKTQLAVEYAHRYQSEYDLVWWVPSDQPMLIASTLARLAPHLDLPAANATGSTEAAEAVVDALRRGDPVARWLLIFDNAQKPEEVIHFVPDGPGHVIITSRNSEWSGAARTLKVGVFGREESRDFLDRKVPGIAAEEADSLADALGDLPLALVQAGALQSATGMPVDDYLELLENQTSKLLAEGRPSDYSVVPLTATWSVSVRQLREDHPDAVDLLNLTAFFGPDPIPRDVLSGSHPELDAQLAQILGDPLRFSKAIGALGRYSLVQIDRERRTVEVHRLVQKLLRDSLSEEQSEYFRHCVDLLLAAADPSNPDDTQSWPGYARLLPHIGPASVATCPDRSVRFLMRGIIRYLYQSGNATAALKLARECQQNWTSDPDSDPLDICAINRHLGFALRSAGHFREALEVNRQALADATALLPPDHDEVLRITNNYCIDLRAAGHFAEALEMSRRLVARHVEAFGESDGRTLRAQNNLALDYTLTSSYDEAKELLTKVHSTMRAVFGTSHPSVQRAMNNLIRVIRLSGDFESARELGEDLHAANIELLGADHPTTLRGAKDLAIATRMVEGGSAGAVAFTEDLLKRFQRLLGEQHPDTLAAEIMMANMLRDAGRVHEAIPLTEHALEAYADMYRADHPYEHACRSNLALLFRHAGDPDKARMLNEASLRALIDSLGADHHLALICAVGLASDHSALGDHTSAVELGRSTLSQVTGLLGPDQPPTFGAAANLALDLESLGHADEAARLRNEALGNLRDRLGSDHPWVRKVMAGERLEFDFDPIPL
ncbi:FxSxx-COOH system tetratricopeptide repeat protein [Actinomadura scrupuli]|uniref:FxSxx-COOH system tetratricopeptide repeat protein n=1 Tax=Actinomadura scrupuli TaxID=559629 RepID=UPI003D97F3BB